MAVLFGLFLLAMLGLHLLKPRFKTKRISSAAFFSELPPAKNDATKSALKPPTITPVFILRMLAAIALLLSLFDLLSPSQNAALDKNSHSQNLWLMLDTSASMTTLTTNNQSNFSLAKQQAIQLLDQHIDPNQPICITFSTFNSVHQHQGQFNSVQPLLAQLQQLKPTTLSTNLTQLRRHISANKEKAQCAKPLMVVISDQSSPVWVNQIEQLVWKDVGGAVANVGFTKLTTNTNRFNTTNQQIAIEAGYWHKAQPTTLTITDPDGDVISTQTTDWSNTTRWHTFFAPLKSGLHRLKLSPGGAYALDDEVTIEVTLNPPFVVDWQMQDSQLKSLFNWQHNPQNASLRVMPIAQHDNSNTPTIYIMDATATNSESLNQISGFRDNDPLLVDLSFDLMETLPLPQSNSIPGIQKVLWSGQKFWIAQHQANNAVYLPALPQLTGSPQDKMLTVAFFNALRVLTNNDHDQMTHSTLHPGEGNTAQAIKSHGVVSFVPQTSDEDQQNNQWILWFTLFTLFMAIERALNTWGRASWR